MKHSVKARFTEHIQYRGLAAAAVLAALAVTAGFAATPEKAHQIEVHRITKDVPARNFGCTEAELNPLREDGHPRISRAVKDYYTELARKKDFIEKYDDLRIYTKVGEYRDTYIVFVGYRMKIKDVYTEVPGMSTLYAVNDRTNKTCQVSDRLPDGGDDTYIRLLAEHEDVLGLMQRTQEEYEAAVQSDALLAEALSDLKKALGT